VTEGQRSYFAGLPDPDTNSQELVGAIISTSLQRSELILLHCLNSSYKNWRIKVSMLVKADGVRNGRFVSRMWLPSNGQELKGKNMNIGFQGTFDWRRSEFTFDLGRYPFAIGVEMIGQGKVFIKNVTVTRVENLRPYD
jgi:hypothetical protein